MESCTAGSGRPVSGHAASLTKTEVSQRVPTEDLILVRKAPFVFHYCRAGGTSDIDYHNPDIDWDPQFGGFLVPPPVGVFGRSGVPTPRGPGLEGL